MLKLTIERIGELAVIECHGRIVQSEAAAEIREAVTSLCNERIIVLDLSEVRAVAGIGLGMLCFLQRWTHDNDIQLRLFSPTESVRKTLERVTPTPEFHMITLPEMMTLLASADSRFALVA